MRSFFLCLFIASTTFAQDQWVGKKFMPMMGVKVRNGSQEITRYPAPFVVIEVIDEWLDIGPGFIHKSGVVPLQDAAAYYNEYLRDNPGSAHAHMLRGVVWKANGELDKAIKDYTEVIRLEQLVRLSRGHAAAYNNRAWLRATANDPFYRNGKQAVDDATRACELTDWKSSNMVETLAAAYAEAGDFQKATKFLKKAQELGPARFVEVRKKMLDEISAGRAYRDDGS